MPPPKRNLSGNERKDSLNNLEVKPIAEKDLGGKPIAEKDLGGKPIAEKDLGGKPTHKPGVEPADQQEPPNAEFRRLQVEELQPSPAGLSVRGHKGVKEGESAVQKGRPSAPDLVRGSLNMTMQQCQRFRYNGKYPCLAVNNNNQAVVVYHHNNFINDMYYCVGRLNPADGNIVWGEEHWYDTGAYPRVAVNNSGVVVEVHESPRKRKTWYHVGVIYDDKIDWGHSYEIGHGLHPGVALSLDGEVVIVEESGGMFSPEAYYFFGKVNEVDKTIQFSRKREMLVHSAKEPTVSMMGKNIVVAFRHESKNGKLYSMLGRIDGLNIQWAEYEFHHFAEGNWPSISVNVDNVIVATCQTFVNRRVLCREGMLREKDGSYYVEWSRRDARQYEHGVYPSVCLLEGNRLVELHGTSKLNGHSLWYALGYVS